MFLKKKKDKSNIAVSAQYCYLEMVPLQIFGEKVLQLLHIRDLMAFNDAITNHNLRNHWWFGGLLQFAISDRVPITVRTNFQLRSLLTLNLRVKNLHFHLEDLNNALVSEVFASFGNNIHSLAMSSSLDKKYREGGLGNTVNPNVEASIELYLTSLCDTIIPFASNFKTMRINAIDDINDLFFPKLDLLLGFCSNLTCLDLRNILMTRAIFSGLLALPQQLCSLTLSRMASYRDAEYWSRLAHNNASVLQQILQTHCPTNLLTWIDLSDNLYHFRMTDACVDIISALCPLLEHLDISIHDGPVDGGQYGLVTDQSLVPLAARCVHLKTALMESHMGISSTTVDALLSFCRAIGRIDVSYTSVTGRYIVDKRGELVEEGRECRLCRKFNWRCNISEEEESVDGGSDGDEEDNESRGTLASGGNYHGNLFFDCPHQGL